MQYYMIQPFFTPDGHSIDYSMSNEAISNIVESAYWAIDAEVEVMDKRVTRGHNDFLIFRTISALEKAADILEHYEIQFKTNIIEKATQDNADFVTKQAYYKLVIAGEPDVDGADNVYHPRIYTIE